MTVHSYHLVQVVSSYHTSGTLICHNQQYTQSQYLTQINCSGHGEQSVTAGLSVCTEHATVTDRGQFGQWPGPAASHGMDGLGAIPM